MDYTLRMLESIFENMINGYAYHQIIIDENNYPIDYVFLDVNPAFEKMTGLTKDQVIGKKVTEVIPGFSDSKFDWIGVYGSTALAGKKHSFQEFSEGLKRWYLVNVFSPQHGFFITIFNEITDLKQKEEELLEKNENLTALLEEVSAMEEELRQQVDELSLQRDNLGNSEDRLKRAQALAHVGNWELDLFNNTIWASEEAFRIYGITRTSPYLPLAEVQEQVDSNDRSVLDLALRQLLDSKKEYSVEFTITRNSDGQRRIIHSVAELVLDNMGTPQKALGVIHDITEHKEAELKIKKNNEELTALYEEIVATEEELRTQYEMLALLNEKLRLSEERYKLSLEGANDGIWDWDIKEDKLYVSDRCRELVCFGSNIIDCPKEYLQKIVHPEDIYIILENFRKHLNGETQHLNCEHRILEQKNQNLYRWILVRGKAVWDINGKAYRMAGSLTDISEIKRQHEVIHKLAYYDSITGFPNKVLFQDRLNVATHYASRNEKKVALVFLDLDNFKKINDTQGHLMGDEVLKEASIKINSCIRNYDTLARFGGDEFIVLMQDIENINEVATITERIKNIFNNPLYVNKNPIYITFSMGIALFPDDGDDINELLKNADTAMYKAKELGKNNIQFYNKAMNEEILRKIDIENSLRTAVENQELFLEYQPCFALKEGKIKGFEALLRWSNRKLGAIPPLNFIPIAEETGMIIKIGEWVLKKACQQNKEWQVKFNINTVISVNISPIQLKHINFIYIVRKTLQETGLKPEYLELEITENILIDSIELITDKLNELRQLGIRIALDDFGTGFSSLSYLKRLPLNTVKIDKSFIADIFLEENNSHLVGAIITIAHLMGLKIIAEGVETKEQLDYLLQAGCDGIQGYLFSEPISVNEVPLFLSKRGKL